MNSRIVAFFISQNQENSDEYMNAAKHLATLSNEFGLRIYHEKVHSNNIILCFEGAIENLIQRMDGVITFCVGPALSQKMSGHFADNNNLSVIRDRFLKISIGAKSIIIVNDYAGTIPVYYSLRDTISLSNIEPVTVLDSHTTANDISVANMYGFLRYSHYIWDETLYNHIFTQEPDTQYIFPYDKKKPVMFKLNTVTASKKRYNFDDYSVAKELFELNQKLVQDSLSQYDEIILPLSAGYDSRMIFSAICKMPDLKLKLKCFTYGPEGSIEVESARSLCESEEIFWENIDLPCHFLDETYLKKIGLIFGSSLHFHGMYQLEFWDCIKSKINSNNFVLTSGFMTGVPAGQHISLLNIQNYEEPLILAMNKFSQSNYFSDDELLGCSDLFPKNAIKNAELKFRQAFNRLDGSLYNKSVMFDIWTRQRNFIAYYPRTLEWEGLCVSPHMTPEYANFFLSLSDRHLKDRLAVELMFKHFYADQGAVLSNSNGVKAIGNPFETIKFLILNHFHGQKIKERIPKRYWNTPIQFNIKAIKYSKKEGLWPIFNLNKDAQRNFHKYFPESLVTKWYHESISGSIESYEKLVFIQSIAYGLSISKNLKNV
ncbi:MAG: hypothetical protein ABFD07_12050 [Methanobacterium sp.]